MEIGLVLSGSQPWPQVVARASQAASLGLGSVWLCDSADSVAAAPELEPLTALAALARATTGVRLGTFLSAPRRPPAVAAKAMATIDLLGGGRLVLALGAGPEGPGSPEGAVDQLGEAVQVLRGAFGGGPFTFEGRHYRVQELRCRPRPLQRPAPPILITGGQEVLRVVGRHADGWVDVAPGGTLEEHQAMAAALGRACEEAGREPASVSRFVRRTLLVGQSEAWLRRRWQEASQAGVAEASGPLDHYRRGRLVGTPEQVGEQLSAWREAGVATLMVDPWPLALPTTSADDLELLASVASSVH